MLLYYYFEPKGVYMRLSKDICGTRKGAAFLLHALYICAIVFITLVFALSIFAACYNPMPVRAEESTSYVVKKTIYHVHTGGSGGGGCYSVHRTGTRTYEVPCGGTLHYWGDSWGTSECNRCGAGYYGNRGGESCPHSETRSESYSYYELGCGKSPSTELGYVTYTLDTTEWAKEVHVTVEFENVGVATGDKPYIKNGEAFEDGHFTLTENGHYDFRIAGDANSGTGAASYSVDIHNIDNTAPIIDGYTLMPSDWVREGVEFHITSAVDIQPDGSQGCGLDDLPFSYDGGETWTDENTRFYEENGDYEILVRDKLGNTGSLSIHIDNIDNEAPNIESIEYDHTSNITDVTIKVTCNDILSDGREGAGLAELPYSYDGGKTWTDLTELHLTHNAVIEFVVKDKLDNQNSERIEIDNIDDYAPMISHILYPGYWTNQDVEVIFEAKDVNPDGSKGIGLPDDCYSYDSGNTWTDDNIYVVSDNCEVGLAVRDRNGNIAYYCVTVINIDRIPPVITADATLSTDKGCAVLTADGSDGQSGIDYSGFTWTGPAGDMTGSIVTVYEDGIYTVTGRDNAGNTQSAQVCVEGIKKPFWGILHDGSENSRKLEGNIEVKKVVKPASVNKKEVVSTATIDAMEPAGNRSFWDILRNLLDKLLNWWNSLKNWQKVLFALLIAGILLGLLWLLWLWYRSVSIYNDKGDESYRFMGKKYIGRKDGIYTVTISENLWERLVTTHIQLRFSRLFAMLHKDDEIRIMLPHNRGCVERIEKTVDIVVK